MDFILEIAWESTSRDILIKILNKKYYYDRGVRVVIRVARIVVENVKIVMEGCKICCGGRKV
jgi:hypothetical protein